MPTAVPETPVTEGGLDTNFKMAFEYPYIYEKGHCYYWGRNARLGEKKLVMPLIINLVVLSSVKITQFSGISTTFRR